MSHLRAFFVANVAITGDPYSIKRHAYSIHNFISTQSTSMREIIAGTEGWGGGRGRRRRYQARILLLIIMALHIPPPRDQQDKLDCQ